MIERIIKAIIGFCVAAGTTCGIVGVGTSDWLTQTPEVNFAMLAEFDFDYEAYASLILDLVGDGDLFEALIGSGSIFETVLSDLGLDFDLTDILNPITDISLRLQSGGLNTQFSADVQEQLNQLLRNGIIP
jgi:hypothetical protein